MMIKKISLVLAGTLLIGAMLLTGCSKKSLTPRQRLDLAVDNTCSYLLDGREYRSLRLTGFAGGLSFDCLAAAGEQGDGTLYIQGSFGYDVVRNLSVNACISPDEAVVNIPLLSRNSFLYRYGDEPRGLITEYIPPDYFEDFNCYLKLAVDADVFGLLKSFKEGTLVSDIEEPLTGPEEWDDKTLCFSFPLKVLPRQGELFDLKDQVGDFRLFVKDNYILKLEMYNTEGRKLLSLDFPKEGLQPGESRFLRLITYCKDNITSDIDIEVSDKTPAYNKTESQIDIFSITEDILNEIKESAEEEYIFYF